jgi:hypothetical protein
MDERTGVKAAVNNRDVDRNEQQDWLGNEHLERASKRALEKRARRPDDTLCRRIHLCMALWEQHAEAARLSGEVSDDRAKKPGLRTYLLCHECRRVRLGQDEDREERRACREECDDPENESPAE